MKETSRYRGHSIDLDLKGTSCAQVRWTYFIDDDYCCQGTMDRLPIETVRVRALALAHGSIDLLDAMRSGNGDPAPSSANGSRVVATMMDHGSQRFAARQ